MNRLLCACIGLPAHCLCHPVCHRSGAHWGNCMAHLPALAWGSLAPACNNLPLGAAGAHCTHAEACWVPSKGTMPAARKSCNAIPSLSPAGHPACRWLGLFKTLAQHVADEEKDTLAYEVSVSEDDPTKILIYERCVVWKCTSCCCPGPCADSKATSDWYSVCSMIRRAAGCTVADAVLDHVAAVQGCEWYMSWRSCLVHRQCHAC